MLLDKLWQFTEKMVNQDGIASVSFAIHVKNQSSKSLHMFVLCIKLEFVHCGYSRASNRKTRRQPQTCPAAGLFWVDLKRLHRRWKAYLTDIAPRTTDHNKWWHTGEKSPYLWDPVRHLCAQKKCPLSQWWQRSCEACLGQSHRRGEAELGDCGALYVPAGLWHPA